MTYLTASYIQQHIVEEHHIRPELISRPGGSSSASMNHLLSSQKEFAVLWSSELQHPLWLLLDSLLKKHMRSCHPQAPWADKVLLPHQVSVCGCPLMQPRGHPKHLTEREGKQLGWVQPSSILVNTVENGETPNPAGISMLLVTYSTDRSAIPQPPFLAEGLIVALGLLNKWLHLGVS